MNRSPFLFSRYPPSPRTPSVIRTPAPATPVGWNCQNSMSSRGKPARAAMPRPSPVQMNALVVEEKIRPAPPVAKSVARACRTLAEVLRMAAGGPLVYRAVLVAIERHAEVLELVHELGRFAHHEFDRVLVAEPVRALHRIVHVPQPRVLAHVAERRADPALRRHGVRASREYLGKHCDAQARLRQLQRGAQASTARPHHDRVETALCDGHLKFSRGSASPSRRSFDAVVE